MNIEQFKDVTDFLENLSREDRAVVRAHIQSLGINQTDRLLIKQLKGKIKELIVKQYRIIFVIIDNTVFLLDGFKKQSQKTPKRIIERAEKIYHYIINNNFKH